MATSMYLLDSNYGWFRIYNTFQKLIKSLFHFTEVQSCAFWTAFYWNNQYSWKSTRVSISSTPVGSGVSLFLLLFLFPPCTAILTSADTDQVASSPWVSTEPSNRKQVRPDTPASMLNVAVKKHWALFWPCQAASAQAPVWGTASGLCISIWSVRVSVCCVFIAFVVGRNCQVCMCWWSSEHYWQGHFSACVCMKVRRAHSPL